MDGKCKSCLYNVGEYNSKSRPRSNQLLYDLFIYIIQTRWLHDNYHSLKYCNSGTSQSSNFKPRNVQSSNLQGNVSYHYSAVTTLLWSRLSYLMHDNNMVCIFCTSLSPCCKNDIIQFQGTNGSLEYRRHSYDSQTSIEAADSSSKPKHELKDGDGDLQESSAKGKERRRRQKLPDKQNMFCAVSY